MDPSLNINRAKLHPSLFSKQMSKGFQSQRIDSFKGSQDCNSAKLPVHNNCYNRKLNICQGTVSPIRWDIACSLHSRCHSVNTAKQSIWNLLELPTPFSSIYQHNRSGTLIQTNVDGGSKNRHGSVAAFLPPSLLILTCYSPASVSCKYRAIIPNWMMLHQAS